MSDEVIYQKFISWLGKTWWGLPDSAHLLPLIQSRYSVEEAQFLTGFPFAIVAAVVVCGWKRIINWDIIRAWMPPIIS